MTIIRISEQARIAAGRFRVLVRFGDNNGYDLEITQPFSAVDEAELAWYFEQHQRHPFLDAEREQMAVRQIADYGEALFRQVFGGESNHDYRKLRDRSFDDCRLEVRGSAVFHRLHWEALREPGADAPLAVLLPITRQTERPLGGSDLPDSRPTLNILVVAARPDGPRDAGYRTMSRPLLEALLAGGLPIRVDLVRPGTWEALRARLRSTAQLNGPGWYHVIHFDLQGGFSDYAPLAKGRTAQWQALYSGLLKSAEREHGFLRFETTKAGRAEPVPAEAVAALLHEHQVPVVVLNSCQPAVHSASEAGLAERLAEAGVPVTVGMTYSATVSAARRALPVFYGRLAKGADPAEAMQDARRELFGQRARRAYFNQQIDLEDWMLPVVFGQHQLRIQAGEGRLQISAQAGTIGEEPATEYGFVGRDLDIQAIESRLLADEGSNALLVHGMSGVGKSALLEHLAWWWHRTGLVGHVFRFSYETRPWTCSQIVREIRSALFTPTEHAQADALTEPDQAQQVAELLRTQRHLLILDNAESITAAPAAIPHVLDSAEQEKLKSFLSRLRAGRSLVLIGSRQPEAGVTAGSFGMSSYLLSGLDPQAASILVERVLRHHGGDHYLQDEAERKALEDLVSLLDGCPLSLTVVLSALASVPPTVVLRELQEDAPGADPVGLIHRAIEYSHGAIDPALQNSLLPFAPFTSVVATGELLESYQDLLLQNEVVRSLGQINLTAALNQAITAGLAAAPHPQLSHLTRLRQVLPYFLDIRLQRHPALRAAIDQAHYQLYDQFGEALRHMLFSADNPQHRAAGLATARAEYANLATALRHGLRTGQLVINLIGPLDKYLEETQQHDTRRRLLDDSINSCPEPANREQQQELANLHNRAGDTAIAENRFDDAKRHYETELSLMQMIGDRSRQGATYFQLARVAAKRGKKAEAEQNFRKALDIVLESGYQRSAAYIYHQLGLLANARQGYAEAEDAYRKALGIYRESGDLHKAAGVHNNLGLALLEQQRYGEAETSLRKALDIYLESEDSQNAVAAYKNLAAVAQVQHLYEKAEENYRKAFDLERKSDQRAARATAVQIADVLRKLGRHGDAARVLRSAGAADATDNPDQEQPAGVRTPQVDALTAGNDALRSAYESGDIDDIAHTHLWLGSSLAVRDGDRPSAIAHVLAGGLICTLADLERLEDALRLSESLMAITPGANVIPKDLAELCRWAGESPGVELKKLLAQLAGGQASAEARLRQLISRVRTRIAESSRHTRWIASWDPIIAGIVAEARGDTAASNMLDRALERYLNNPEWAALAHAFGLIRNGQQEIDTTDLDSTDIAILRRVAAVFSGKESIPRELWPAMGYGEWLGDVVAAARGDSTFERSAQEHIGELATHNLTSLSNALQRILQGERSPGIASNLADSISRAIVTNVLYHVNSQ